MDMTQIEIDMEVYQATLLTHDPDYNGFKRWYGILMGLLFAPIIRTIINTRLYGEWSALFLGSQCLVQFIFILNFASTCLTLRLTHTSFIVVANFFERV